MSEQNIESPERNCDICGVLYRMAKNSITIDRYCGKCEGDRREDLLPNNIHSQTWRYKNAV